MGRFGPGPFFYAMLSVRVSYAGVTFFDSQTEAAFSMGILDFRQILNVNDNCH
jgi:hypothetical protein